MNNGDLNVINFWRREWKHRMVNMLVHLLTIMKRWRWSIHFCDGHGCLYGLDVDWCKCINIYYLKMTFYVSVSEAGGICNSKRSYEKICPFEYSNYKQDTQSKIFSECLLGNKCSCCLSCVYMRYGIKSQEYNIILQSIVKGWSWNSYIPGSNCWVFSPDLQIAPYLFIFVFFSGQVSRGSSQMWGWNNPLFSVCKAVWDSKVLLEIKIMFETGPLVTSFQFFKIK